MIKKATFVSLGAISFLFGAVLLSNVHGLTGYSIYDNLGENMRYFVGVNFIVLSFLMFLAAKDWTKYKIGISVAVRDYEASNYSPIMVAVKIDSELKSYGYSVVGVDYGGDFNIKIKFDGGDLAVRVNDREKAKNLALALYEVVLMDNPDNGSNCNLHISNYASSEMHEDGLNKVIKKFELAHRVELKAVREEHYSHHIAAR